MIGSMHAFDILELAAWGISALLGLWMLFDLLKTNRDYSDDVLISSKEGEIDDALVVDPRHEGGHQ